MSQPTREDRHQQLLDELLELGGLVEELLIESVDLLKQNDLDALERLNEDSRQIHKKRLTIEMGCLSLIATRRPRDDDLRRLVATVEIAAELEHVGDHARRVARVNYLVADHQLRRPLSSVQRLTREVQAPLDRVLAAFVQQELAPIERALAETQAVSTLYEQTYRELLTVMKSKPRIANQAIYLSRAAYDLKRAAERVARVCEWVVFSITGTMGQATMIPPQVIKDVQLTQDDNLVN
jgi:phosphate transport system protein